MVTAENGSNHPARIGESSFLEEWQDIISRLPSDFQEQAQSLPKDCQENAILLTTKCHQIVDEFPRYPFTSFDLAQFSGQLEQRASHFTQGLARCGDRPFKNIWLKKLGLLKQATEGSGRKELGVALSELIFQDAQKRFTSDNLGSPLFDYCSEATMSFIGPSVAWAMISDQPAFGNNFFLLPSRIYRLGVSVIEIVNCGKEEILLVKIPYIEGGRIRPKFFAAPLKEPISPINGEAGK